MFTRYAVYHPNYGYYNFILGAFENYHDYNFTVSTYSTGNHENAVRLAAEFHASVITC